MLAAIVAFLNAFPAAVNLFEQFIATYQADVKLRWASALQAGLQPLENGATTDAQKQAAAKAVADAINQLH